MMYNNLDSANRKILDLIQHNFPLVARPFEWVAQQTSTTEQDVIERLARLKQAGMVREICAVFDSERLGYRSTLAAMAIEPARLEEVAAVVSAHPGVSHNYARAHEFNLWFTLSVGGDRSVADEVARLAREAKVSDFLVLPALRRFKIGVDFDLGTREEQSGVGRQPAKSSANSEAAESGAGCQPAKGGVGCQPAKEIEPPPPVPLTAREKDAIRVLQCDLPLNERPFERVAAGIAMSESELLAVAERLKATGVLRRFGAILHHQHVGYSANGMVGWVIPPDRLEAAGQRAAAERAVSHCYERPTFPPRWPYNLMTMIHGRSENEVLAVVERLRLDLQPTDHAVLFSRREFKKQRVHYFEE